MIHTVEQIEQAIEDWENGDMFTDSGLCYYFWMFHRIDYYKTASALKEAGYSSAKGYIYLFPPNERQPRIEALKKMLKYKQEEE